MWTSECVVLLRHLINDLAATPTYCDERLKQLLLVAAQLVKTEVSFATTYSVDMDEFVLSPDPTLVASRDDSFVNLMVLKSACIIDQSEARAAAGKAISVVDSIGFRLDTRSGLDGRLALLKQGYCAAYAQAKMEYQLNKLATAGATVMTPFRDDSRTGRYNNVNREGSAYDNTAWR